MKLTELFPENLYHSYVIEGNPEEVPYILREFLEERGDIEKQSPDLLFQLYDAFAVLDSGKIKDWHKNRPIGSGKKICIMGAKFINREAEQSLLKIIEEPNIGTHFFIIVPDSSLLVETILSRVHVVKNIENSHDYENEIAINFIKLSLSDRLEKILEIIKEFKDAENSGGLRFRATSLINGIERIVYKKWKDNLGDKDLKFILEELKNSREFLSIPGASVKMILEHIALVV